LSSDKERKREEDGTEMNLIRATRLANENCISDSGYCLVGKEIFGEKNQRV
jgi:hypothetical protein